MGIHDFASRYTSKELVTGDLTLTVLSGEPVQVRGVIMDNHTGVSVRIAFSTSGGDEIFDCTVPACQSFELSIPFLADKGIVATADFGGVHVCVFHNSPGN